MPKICEICGHVETRDEDDSNYPILGVCDSCAQDRQHAVNFNFGEKNE